MSGITVRKATSADLHQIKRLADSHRHELGFVLLPALAKSIGRDELLVAVNSSALVGFVEYHHRRDAQTTLYHLVVDSEHRGLGIGRSLVETLVSEARKAGKSRIQLKCPADLKANSFYARVGFSRAGTKSGRKRELVLWRMDLG
jgi:GNAT superfamily N-acetyltransferase